MSLFLLFKFRKMNIRNKTYYFYNDLTNIKDFNARLLKLDKKTSIGLGIYYIGYVTKNLNGMLIV